MNVRALPDARTCVKKDNYFEASLNAEVTTAFL